MQAGESWLVIGPNGGGKADFLQALAGEKQFINNKTNKVEDTIFEKSAETVSLERAALLIQEERDLDESEYIDKIDDLDVGKYLNHTECVLVPNLTYSPRACFMPKGCIADGSVAILTTANNIEITARDLAYYATDEFCKFYSIARNRGTRSLNIDNNSVFFFGKQK